MLPLLGCEHAQDPDGLRKGLGMINRSRRRRKDGEKTWSVRPWNGEASALMGVLAEDFLQHGAAVEGRTRAWKVLVLLDKLIPKCTVFAMGARPSASPVSAPLVPSRPVQQGSKLSLGAQAL